MLFFVVMTDNTYLKTLTCCKKSANCMINSVKTLLESTVRFTVRFLSTSESDLLSTENTLKYRPRLKNGLMGAKIVPDHMHPSINGVKASSLRKQTITISPGKQFLRLSQRLKRTPRLRRCQ